MSESSSKPQDGEEAVGHRWPTTSRTRSVTAAEPDLVAVVEHLVDTPAPLTLVPLLEPRSRMNQASPSRTISAWRRLTVESASSTSHSGARPMMTGSSPTATREPSPSTSAARGQAAGALAHLDDQGELALLEVGVLEQLDLDRTEEAVAAVAGVLAHGLFEFAYERVGEGLEAFRVDLAQRDDGVVGRDGAAHRHRAVGVDLTRRGDGRVRRAEARHERLSRTPLRRGARADARPAAVPWSAERLVPRCRAARRMGTRSRTACERVHKSRPPRSFKHV